MNRTTVTVATGRRRSNTPSRNMDVKLCAAAMCWLVMSFAGGCICGGSLYRRIESLDNLEVTATASKTQGNISSVLQCARLCRQQDCMCLRHDGDVCSLYDVPVTAGSAPAHGASYYGKVCATGLDYVSAVSVNLYYKLSNATDTKKWEESLDACHVDGGRLAVLDTDARHNFIKSYLADGGARTDYVWVGMNKSTTSGPFRWLTGSTHVTEWSPGEPDYVSHQNCVYTRDGRLFDGGCNSRMRRLCEYVL